MTRATMTRATMTRATMTRATMTRAPTTRAPTVRAAVAAVAATAAVLLLGGCGTSPDPAAGCAGPEFTVAPGTVAAGGEVRVEGRWLFDDCYDTGQTGTPPATQDVEVRLVPTGDPARSFPLATVDADADGRIDTAVRIPVDVPPGPARIDVGYGAAADLVVTAP